MRDWELKVCPACGRDHCREAGRHRHALPCADCGTEMVTVRLMPETAAPASTNGAKPSKHHDRLELLRDANYFASELVRRLERLEDIERHGHTQNSWRQAAALTRRIRALARHQADDQRHKAKLKLREAA